jgi:glucose-6-phosphate 1-dehydrogenase
LKPIQENPFVQHTVIAIFGASGDLTARKLVPALFNNFRKGRLPADTKIVGMARSPFTDESFRAKMREGMQQFAPKDFNAEKWQAFAPMLFYQPGDMTKAEAYSGLEQKITSIAPEGANRLYYLSTAPEFYPTGATLLGESSMSHEDERAGFRRIIIEKPFGSDLASAMELNRTVHRAFREHQVYRIDHYLGKETVQNILVFRFANAIFEPLWNRNYIDHVQITVSETVGVGHRAGYYDKAGVLRDMFQNHILQLLTLIAMEPPHKYEADALRNKKVEVLSALRPIGEKDVAEYTVRAQYEGYMHEPGVEQFSATPTYAALKLFVDNWRWQGVPFYLRSGKFLPEKTSEITIQFRQPPQQLFHLDSEREGLFTNRLSICVQPHEGFHLLFTTKVPDKGMQVQPVDMDFHYKESFGEGAIPEAYERLLLDALNGDASLFTRSDEIELAWKLVDCIHAGWASKFAPPMASYKPNTWGPKAAEILLARDERRWVHGCGSTKE